MKRATLINSVKNNSISISIHALVKRATKGICKSKISAFNFNPRPREEGDYMDQNAPDTYAISIHALVKRATLCK